MADDMTLNFADYMRENTALSEGSILLYSRTIGDFLSKNKELTVHSVNAFITNSVRNKNSSYKKYAFKHYCDFVDRKDVYDGLVQVKVPPRKKLGKYSDRSGVLDLINSVSNKKYHDVAIIQFATAARARGILTLHENNIDFTYDEKTIRLRLVEKGKRESYKFLLRKYEPLLRSYCGKGYLFLPEIAARSDSIQFERLVNNERVYYYLAIRKAADLCGIVGFGTHDFRRNAAEILSRETKDPRLVQSIMGHKDIRLTMRYFDEAEKHRHDAFVAHQSKGGSDDI